MKNLVRKVEFPGHQLWIRNEYGEIIKGKDDSNFNFFKKNFPYDLKADTTISGAIGREKSGYVFEMIDKIRFSFADPPPPPQVTNQMEGPQSVRQITPRQETDVVDRINRSQNTDQAKLSVIDSEMKDLVAIGLKETEINSTRKLWDEASRAVVRITDKIANLESENDNLADESNKAKLKRLKGDESPSLENLIKNLEEQTEGLNKIINQEKDNLRGIKNERADVASEILLKKWE